MLLSVLCPAASNVCRLCAVLRDLPVPAVRVGRLVGSHLLHARLLYCGSFKACSTLMSCLQGCWHVVLACTWVLSNVRAYMHMYLNTSQFRQVWPHKLATQSVSATGSAIRMAAYSQCQMVCLCRAVFIAQQNQSSRITPIHGMAETAGRQPEGLRPSLLVQVVWDPIVILPCSICVQLGFAARFAGPGSALRLLVSCIQITVSWRDARGLLSHL